MAELCYLHSQIPSYQICAFLAFPDVLVKVLLKNSLKTFLNLMLLLLGSVSDYVGGDGEQSWSLHTFQACDLRKQGVSG